MGSFSLSFSITFGLGSGATSNNHATSKQRLSQASNSDLKDLSSAIPSEVDKRPRPKTGTAINHPRHKTNKKPSSHERHENANPLQVTLASSTEEQDHESLAVLMQHTKHTKHTKRAKKTKPRQVSRKKAYYETPEKTTFWPKDLRKKILPTESSPTDRTGVDTRSIETAFDQDDVVGLQRFVSGCEGSSSSSLRGWSELKPSLPVEEMGDDFWTTDDVGGGKCVENDKINDFLELLKSVQISGVAEKGVREMGAVLQVVGGHRFVEDSIMLGSSAKRSEEDGSLTRNTKGQHGGSLSGDATLENRLTDAEGLDANRPSVGKPSGPACSDEAGKQDGPLEGPWVVGLDGDDGWEVIND